MSNQNEDPIDKPRNFVHKHMNEFNHSVVMKDKKKASKKQRHPKHKGKGYE